MNVIERYKALAEGQQIRCLESKRIFQLTEFGLQRLENGNWVDAGNVELDRANYNFEIYTPPLELYDWAWVLSLPEGTKVQWHEWGNKDFFWVIRDSELIDSRGCPVYYKDLEPEYFVKKGWQLHV